MTFQVTLGWWLIPTAFTLAAYGWHVWMHWNEPRSTGYGTVGSAIGYALTYLVFLVAALLSWCVYFGIWSFF